MSAAAGRRPVPPAITAQPTVKKDNAVVSDGPADVSDHNDSIICRQCRRCKCEACRNPRHLPSKWICNNKCLCSASNIVDYCSCMCCVRGLFITGPTMKDTDFGPRTSRVPARPTKGC
ncbi:hypothetical protein TNIN_124601 [Trichonephila inaurata madagascariensis]|uniref:Uncharacterized protein n=1 Tax=Trichonephila inaurata madagascariensis TaxID=2747483 RepID=A0A8X7C7T5_9ARAC|nr:hypothetical protein TNIN_124601 [Trichonephila inaurata madagascariensis]